MTCSARDCGGIGRFGALRNDSFQLQATGILIKGLAAPDLVIAEVQRRARTRKQLAEALLAFRKRPRADGLAIEVQEIEQEKDQGLGVARIGRGLDQAEGGRAVGPDKPGARQQPDRAQPGMHPVPVEFYFVEPIRPVRRLVDQFGELWFDPTGERRRFGAPPSHERSSHVFSAITRIRRSTSVRSTR
jgi:hypothetical protein